MQERPAITRNYPNDGTQCEHIDFCSNDNVALILDIQEKGKYGFLKSVTSYWQTNI